MTRSYDGTPKPVGSYPDNGINVLIVGTGLAGLTAALECVRKGCRVQVLERYDDINTAGGFELSSPAVLTMDFASTG
jgi:Monoamine oxidase